MEEITKKDFIKLPTIPNDRYFNQDSAKLIERSSEDRIFEYHTQIKSQMSTLSQDLDNVLQKHEQDYLNAFKFKMHEMMQELTELKKSAYKTQLNSKHTEVIKSMQVELDKSIKNSIKYANLTEDYRKKIESVKDKIEELDSDRKFFESKLNSEKRKSQFKRVPKQTEPLLITALETYPLPEKFNRFVATSKSGKLIEELLMKYDRTDTKLLSEVKDLIESRNKNFEKMTNDYKSLISKQKSNSQAFSLEQSSIFSKKSEIEDLFLDCVKEVKKEIRNKYAKISAFTFKTNKSALIKPRYKNLRNFQ